jgi:protocatechuate 3,4-dioxygenase beta subunit
MKDRSRLGPPDPGPSRFELSRLESIGGRLSRRGVLRHVAQIVGGVSALALSAGSARAGQIRPTPSQVAGPYYPKEKPSEADWNLLSVGNGAQPMGEPLELRGTVTNRSGRPVADAQVEIWQADNQGIYDHPRDSERAGFDHRFQGYGTLDTDADGQYRFLTLMPVPYGSRPPHIHVTIRRIGAEALTTQLYLKDHPDNGRDGLFALMMYPGQEKLMIDPQDAALDNGMWGKSARFDFVVF